ncbi:MAG: alpha/beta fold hydrolase [Bacteroidota bacterium]
MFRALLVILIFASPEVIRFTSKNVTLEGDLMLPDGNAKAPVVVFVHGSGRTTRDDYSPVVPELLKAGYAVFRYDKRGVGKSGGEYINVGTHNSKQHFPVLASDAAAAVDALRKHPRINPKKVIIMGGSQAGWIIPIVASLTDVQATICISGPTVPVGEEMFYSDYAEHGTTSQEDADKLLTNFKGPEGFDNIEYVAKMKKPALWVYGGKDISIPVKHCMARLDSTIKASHIPAEMKIYPNADHGIYNRETGNFENYSSVVVSWLQKNVPVN